MSGASALGRRRDTSAARAALARRRQRAAHALQPNNTSNAAPVERSIPPLPTKPTTATTATTGNSRTTAIGGRPTIRSSPLRSTTTSSSTAAADPGGSSKYLSPSKPTQTSSLNAVARSNNNRQSRQQQQQHRSRMHSNDGTATTASITVRSTLTTTPPSINRTNRPSNTTMQQGGSPLRGMPSRSPQRVIHYTTQQKEQSVASASAPPPFPPEGVKSFESNALETTVGSTVASHNKSSTTSNNIQSTSRTTTPVSKRRMAPSPIDTTTATTNAATPTSSSSSSSNNNNDTRTAAAATATRTSSAVLNARLKARYQSPSHKGGRGLPPTFKTATTTTTATKETAKASLPPSSKANHYRPPPPPQAAKNKTLQSSRYTRPVVKPPMALNKHVTKNNKPPPMKPKGNTGNLTIHTATATTTTTTTNTSRAIAASPRRTAVRDRMHFNSTTESNEAAMTPSATNTTSKRMPTPSGIPVTGTSRFNNAPRQQQQQQSPSSRITPQRQEQMSQRLAQRAINAHRQPTPKTSAEPVVVVKQQQPRRVSPPKQFASTSTFFMNDTSILDTSNLLDTTLPPVETPPTNGFTSKKNGFAESPRSALNKSVLLEDVHQQPIADSSGSTTTWNLDSSCLKHHSEIMLRSCASNTTVQREKDLSEDQVDDSVVDCRGLGLGTPQEALFLEKMDAASPVVRHGDTIRILASSQHALGAYHNERYGLQLLFLPIFASSSNREDEEDGFWQVFVAEPESKILVGRAAVESLNNNNNNKNNKNPSTKLGAPIRASVPIVLRHVTSGGVLSMSNNNHGSLTLLTDSFGQQSQGGQAASMDQLRHHDKLLPAKNQTFQFIPFAAPPCPPWAVAGDGETESCLGERLFMTSSYLLHPKRRQAEFESQMGLSQQDRMEMTSKVKEKILMEEVIGSFLGLEGRHIRMNQHEKGNAAAAASFGFHLVGTDGVDFEMSLQHLVEQILPMSTSYIRVQHFVTSHHPGYDHGRVMQAFCEGLDTLLQDYVDFVVQLERQHRNNSNGGSDSSLLTMNNIFFQISPSLHSMSILEHATRAVCDKKGGALINALWSLERQVYMGDMVAKKVLGILLENASMPYLDMMAEWLESGRLNDPYKEFMVQQSSSEFDATQFDGDDWMAMFSIDEQNILEGVTSDDWTKEKIMTTGKYWNAVHTCQVDVGALLEGNSQKIPKLPFNSDSSAIVAYIDSMYQSASRVLVQLMKEKFMLTECLDVMKRYFLLDQGDFVMNFLDAAEDELRKKATEVSVGRVQNWLNASIQMTEQHRSNGDEEDKRPLVPKALRCRFSGKSLISFLESRYGALANKMPLTPSRNVYGESTSDNSGIETFVIDFSYIPFPISLVLSHHAMDKYKLLFRHLVFTKHVERRVIRVWRDHQILKKLGALRGLLGPTFLLRQQMLHFVQNYLYYMSFEVIENNWTEMMKGIEADETKNNRQQTVDDILQVHDAFLERTLEACLLTNQNLVRSLTKLLNTVLHFTNQMKRFMDATRIHNDSSILAAEKQLTVQRNLNERGITPGGTKKKTIHRELMSTKKEREALNDRQTRRVGREVISESYQRMVGRFAEVFNADVSDFMKQLNQHTASGLVANLGVRLDYNGFVTSSIR